MAEECPKIRVNGPQTLEAQSNDLKNPSHFLCLAVPPASPDWFIHETDRGQGHPARPHPQQPGPSVGALGLAPTVPHPTRLPPFAAIEAMAAAGARGRALGDPHTGQSISGPSMVPDRRALSDALLQSQAQDWHPSSPSGPSELGSQARISHRAAKRYGVDRGEWTERAHRRWGQV